MQGWRNKWLSRWRVIQVRTPPRVHMGHQVQYAMARQYALPCRDGNIVTGLDGDAGIEFDMCVHHNQVAHLAGVYIVYTAKEP